MKTSELLSDFYSPNRPLESGQVLELRLRQLREVSPDAATSEVVLGRELYHLGLGIFEEYAGSLEHIDIDEIRERGEAEVRDRIITLDSHIREMSEFQGEPMMGDLVEYGSLLCRLSHAGVSRNNGLPYYTHPIAVAKIIDIAWSRFQSPSELFHFQRVLYDALIHDTFEDSLPRDGGTFINFEGFLVTPKLVESLFDKLGRIDGAAAATTLHVVSKTQFGGDAVQNDPYITKVCRDPDAIIVKVADTHHNNTLDPKGITSTDPVIIQRNLDRSQTYLQNERQLLRALNDEPVALQFAVHAISTVTKQDLQTYAYRPNLMLHDGYVPEDASAKG